MKFGALRSPDGGWIGIDTRPAAVKNFLAYSLTRLGVDHIDIYRPARLDPAVPIEDTIGAIADLVKAGYVRAHRAVGGRAGDDPARARGPPDRRSADRVLAHQPRARGEDLPRARRARHRRHRLRRALARPAERLAARRARATSAPTCPRFTGENRERNQRLVDALQKLAAEKGVRPAQLAIAWVLAKGKSIVPVIGARTRAQLAESLGALSVSLSPADLARIEEAIPPSAVAGTRYDPHQMRILDSER